MVKPTWTQARIDVEANMLADQPEHVRILQQCGDWDYVDTLYHNAEVAAGSGLGRIAAQKAEAAQQREANTRAVWDRVSAIVESLPASKAE